MRCKAVFRRLETGSSPVTYTYMDEDGHKGAHAWLAYPLTDIQIGRPRPEKKRPTADELWMNVAIRIGERSLCERAQVGAVVVSSSGRVEATGYNGPPSGFETEGLGCSMWCSRAQQSDKGTSYGLKCPSVHAEANALLYTDRSRIEGGTLYASRSCCADCVKLIANSGIARVVMQVTADDAHRNPGDVVKFLEECGLEVVVVEGGADVH